jgi:hypothetical protein
MSNRSTKSSWPEIENRVPFACSSWVGGVARKRTFGRVHDDVFMYIVRSNLEQAGKGSKSEGTSVMDGHAQVTETPQQKMEKT